MHYYHLKHYYYYYYYYHEENTFCKNLFFQIVIKSILILQLITTFFLFLAYRYFNNKDYASKSNFANLYLDFYLKKMAYINCQALIIRFFFNIQLTFMMPNLILILFITRILHLKNLILELTFFFSRFCKFLNYYLSPPFYDSILNHSKFHLEILSVSLELCISIKAEKCQSKIITIQL